MTTLTPEQQQDVARRFQAQLIHAHYGTVTALLCACIAPVPLVITFRGDDLNLTDPGSGRAAPDSIKTIGHEQRWPTSRRGTPASTPLNDRRLAERFLRNRFAKLPRPRDLRHLGRTFAWPLVCRATLSAT